MADPDQSQTNLGTTTTYQNWQHINWNYASYNTAQPMYNMNNYYPQCFNQPQYQSFPSQSLSYNFKPFINGGALETSNFAQKINITENPPPLPSEPAPTKPSAPQFSVDDIDKLPPLPPGSPPPISKICDVPLPSASSIPVSNFNLPQMPQSKSGRKKWRKKQRNLMEAIAANNQPNINNINTHNFLPINFIPSLQTNPPSSKSLNNSITYPFTPIVPVKPPIPSLPAPVVSPVIKKPNGFDLPENCPNSLREYITKCQEKCVNKLDRDRMDIILKGKITNANHDGSLWIKDWSKEPMPMLLSENISVSPNQENNKNKNSIIKMQFKKSTNNFVNCYFTSKFKSNLSQSSNNVELYNEDAHMYQQYGSIDNKISCDKNLLNKRAARFSSQSSPKKKPRQLSKSDFNTQKMFSLDDDEFSIDSCHIVGTCTDLEKRYLRLTAAPDSDAVRPLHILKKSLQNVKSKWMINADYHYTCDQLKSIRQDLTVQGIRDPFTVEVYETHARIALEKSDMGEFNQCQTQLCDLYKELKESSTAQKNRNEFLCYSILYCIYTRALSELNEILLTIKESNIKDECIEFALKTKNAWWLSNHIQLFSLYKVAPKMASYLMDMFLARERKNFYLAIAKSYRPTIPISTIQDQMAFNKREDCLAFLKDTGAVISTDNENIDCKASCGTTEA
ncbi:leukocyte receptor cluster member 8 homolog isoform X2 [Daktulosphaira vitifoliae]|uniref:leukocyte receptor cluster member 8 homolog isoform X2 n=1 Tax=Daktulosphaira vitifoliae TaxID=58002 RepID=UPI0021AAFA9A|nr:leukocyte receptor cluster member 8 homolog isoform X2 [Daktulosphaira vitifoliae]